MIREASAGKLLAGALTCALVVVLPGTVHAYVGPGAGFAVAGSFAAIFLAIIASIASVVLWPFLWLVRAPRRWMAMRRARFRRIVVLGLDGVSPELLDRMMEEGRLPNFRALRKEGVYTRLRSTDPPISPVAWSTFQTGVNPGKHAIFDFVSRVPGTYAVRMSFSEVNDAPAGRGATARLLRGSIPFWNLLAQRGIPAASLRVPVTFPCEPFNGWELAAMGVPDLRGTQGSYTLITSSITEPREAEGGLWLPGAAKEECCEFDLPGPRHDGKAATLRMRLRRTGRGEVLLEFSRTVVHLTPGRFSEWVPVEFPWRGGRARGMIQVLLRSFSPDLHLYISPINLDPVFPALPVSWPGALSFYLARRLGRFSTLGICEDMGAVDDGALTKAEFHQQIHLVHRERERQWKLALAVRRTGFLGIVFDLPDRLQHMFWSDREQPPEMLAAYEELDRLVGETRRRMRPGELLMVMSDHGFASFDRAFHLNAWLHQSGYLVLKEGAAVPCGPDAIDWSRTRAYGLGLCGLFLNVKGREPEGVVPPEAADAFREKLRAELLAFRDGDRAVFSDVPEGRSVYTGPYAKDGPDLLLGFARGYRIHAESAVMRVASTLLSDNTLPWQADHCIHRDVVPGIFLSNVPLSKDAAIEDVAATVLEGFGMVPPGYMDGRSLLPGRSV